MIRKHIDLIAVGILLWGAALFSVAHRVQVLRVAPFQRVTIMENRYPPHLAMPEMPRVPETPRIHFALD